MWSNAAPCSPQSRWEQSVPPVPGSLPGTSNNILKNWLHFVPKVQKVFQPMWKEAGPAFLAGGASTAWTLSWKEQLLGFIFHKITPQCYKQMLLCSPQPTHLQVLPLKATKRTDPGYPPSQSRGAEITPCPKAQSLEEKLPSTAASPSNTCEWRKPGSQWQELELSTAFYFIIHFNLLKYSPPHTVLEPKLWFWDTSLGEELC